MTKKLRAIIKSYLDDIASADTATYHSVCHALSDKRTQILLQEAGCSNELLAAMLDTLELSNIERRYVCSRIKEHIKENPDQGPGFNL